METITISVNKYHKKNFFMRMKTHLISLMISLRLFELSIKFMNEFGFILTIRFWQRNISIFHKINGCLFVVEVVFFCHLISNEKNRFSSGNDKSYASLLEDSNGFISLFPYRMGYFEILFRVPLVQTGISFISFQFKIQ